MVLRRELDIIQAELDEVDQLLPEFAASRVAVIELPARAPRANERGPSRSISTTLRIVNLLAASPEQGLTANQVRETLAATGDALKASTVSAILSKLKTDGTADHRDHHYVLRKKQRAGGRLTVRERDAARLKAGSGMISTPAHGGKRKGAGRPRKAKRKGGAGVDD
jgi:hypothetical protein